MKNGNATGDDLIQEEISIGTGEEGMLKIKKIMNRCCRDGRTLMGDCGIE